MNETTQQEKTTQLSSRNETTQLSRRKQLTSSVGTKQLTSSVGTKQLNSALPLTAYNRLYRLYSRIGFFYLLSIQVAAVAYWSSYTRAFGDGPRNFEPWSSDVDDT
ncbi:hypothetical protein TNCV_1781951 [Trichonephila clavipes]|nr:hypothetical protein TNCV_1781951 [Trichonephila clavipes]